MQIEIYRSTTDQKNFAFTKGGTPATGSWKPVGTYSAGEPRLRLPQREEIERELEKGTTAHVECTVTINVRIVQSVLRQP